MENSGALRPIRSQSQFPDQNHRNPTQETVSHNRTAMLVPKKQKVTKSLLHATLHPLYTQSVAPPRPPQQPCNQAFCSKLKRNKGKIARQQKHKAVSRSMTTNIVLTVNCNDLNQSSRKVYLACAAKDFKTKSRCQKDQINNYLFIRISMPFTSRLNFKKKKKCFMRLAGLSYCCAMLPLY